MKTVKGIVLISLLLLFIIYALFELGKYALGPKITILSPLNLSTTNSPSVEFKAIIRNGAFISINDRQMYVDKDGNLNDSLLLMLGYNIISTKVIDRFGRQVENQTVVYRKK